MQKILLIEDHELFTDGLVSLLQDDFTVKTARNAVEMYACLAHGGFDLGLMDLELGDGSEPVRRIMALREAGVAVVILSATANDEILGACKRLGIVGYLDKNMARRKVLASIHAALNGIPVFPIDRMDSLHQRQLTGATNTLRLPQRQLDVLHQLFLQPMPTNQAIAQALHLSVKSVEKLISQLGVNLNVKGRHNIVQAAPRHGYYPQQNQFWH
jgi:DNA-binding NarL/FixJ family response regulator